MRWIWFDPGNPLEAAQHRQTSSRIDEWWRAFTDRERDIAAYFAGPNRSGLNLPEFMQQHLQAIHSGLMWEFGPPLRGDGHRLVITPETDRWLRPLVATVLERAPTLNGWEFYDYRPGESLEWTRNSVKGRAHFELTAGRVQIGTADHRVHLRYMLPQARSDDDQRATNAAFVATESLLGEKVLDEWIGAIGVTPFRKRSFFSFGAEAPPPSVDLEELKDAVDARIRELQRSLPDVPLIDVPDNDDKWTMWKLEPHQQDDYEAQDDMFVGKSMLPAMWIASRDRSRFSSSCFSRHGETFCYVKLDGSAGLDEEHFADKGEIEDALDDALRRERAGCFIGGGTGLRYSYVDLALIDVPRGVEIVRQILQDGNISRRSWILFYDDALAEEWIGIWPDTPAPPRSPAH